MSKSNARTPAKGRRAFKAQTFSPGINTPTKYTTRTYTARQMRNMQKDLTRLNDSEVTLEFLNKIKSRYYLKTQEQKSIDLFKSLIKNTLQRLIRENPTVDPVVTPLYSRKRKKSL